MLMNGIIDCKQFTIGRYIALITNKLAGMCIDFNLGHNLKLSIIIMSESP